MEVAIQVNQFNAISMHNLATWTPQQYASINIPAYELQWNPSNRDTIGPLKCVLIREVSSFQGKNNTYLYIVGTWSSVLIKEVS